MNTYTVKKVALADLPIDSLIWQEANESSIANYPWNKPEDTVRTNFYMLKDENGEPAPVYSVASGLDYPSSGPEHAFLRDLGRVKYDVVDDEEAVDAFFKLAKLEGIIPAIESSHAVAFGMKLAKTMEHGSILINLSGRGDKDMDFVLEKYGIR